MSDRILARRIGECLAALYLEGKHPSYRSFAAYLGVNEASLKRWIQPSIGKEGIGPPGLSALVKIAERTGRSLDWFVGLSDVEGFHSTRPRATLAEDLRASVIAGLESEEEVLVLDSETLLSKVQHEERENARMRNWKGGILPLYMAAIALENDDSTLASMFIEHARREQPFHFLHKPRPEPPDSMEAKIYDFMRLAVRRMSSIYDSEGIFPPKIKRVD